MQKKTTRQILEQYKLAPHKKFGQNFLIHAQTPDMIAQAGNISCDDTIVEVGVGLGALTFAIAKRAKHVIGIEIDKGLIRYHSEERSLPANVTLIHDDILKIDFAELMIQCGSPLKIMANLPYSISNPFIFKLIEFRKHIEWVVVMLQKEVAERLMAQPSTKEYGIPTVLLRSCAQTKKIMTIKPHEFHPQPKIDSVVVHIDFSPGLQHLAGLPPFDHILLHLIVRASFSQRRKTLLNNIANADFFLDAESGSRQHIKEISTKIIMAAGLSAHSRAEDLDLADFIRLTNAAAQWLTQQAKL